MFDPRWSIDQLDPLSERAQRLAQLVPVETKTARSRRTVALPELTIEALRTHRSAQNGSVVSMYVFTTPSGGPLYGTAVCREFPGGGG